MNSGFLFLVQGCLSSVLLGIFVALSAGCGYSPTRNLGPGARVAAGTEKALTPANATVTFGVPADYPASDGATLLVPGFSVVLGNASYAEILRCTNDFSFKTVLGEPVKSIAQDSPTRQDQLMWAWLEAKKNTAQCRILSLKAVANTFLDLSASAGSWRYHGIACINQEELSESLKVRNCNYEIVSTPEKKYDGALSREFLNAAYELSEAEGQLYAKLSTLYTLAQRSGFETLNCESAAIGRQVVERMIAGGQALLKVAIGTAMTAFTGGTAGTILGVMSKVLDMASSAKPLATEQSGCAPAEALAREIERVRSSLAAAIERVTTLRQKLQDLDARYVAPDSSFKSSLEALKGNEQLLEQNNSQNNNQKK